MEAQITLRETVLSMAQERFGTEPEYPFAKYPGYAVLRHPNQKWYGVIMDLPGAKLGLPEVELVDALNVKCGSILTGSLRLRPGFLPAYHMNRENWITILLDGSVDLEQIATLLEVSYDLIGAKKTSRRK